MLELDAQRVASIGAILRFPVGLFPYRPPLGGGRVSGHSWHAIRVHRPSWGKLAPLSFPRLVFSVLVVPVVERVDNRVANSMDGLLVQLYGVRHLKRHLAYHTS